MDRRTLLSIALCSVMPVALRAQAQPDRAITSTIDRLFDAMKKPDTAAVRALFLAGGRVIPMPAPELNADKISALTVDAFVTFAGNNASGSWVERAWNPVTSTSGTLGTVWFDYDIYRDGTLAQCGANSVQLQRVGAEWKIVSMAFSARRTDCPTHPPPGN